MLINDKIIKFAKEKYLSVVSNMQSSRASVAFLVIAGILTSLMLISALAEFPKTIYYPSFDNSAQDVKISSLIKDCNDFAKEKDLYLQAELFGEQQAANLAKNCTLFSWQGTDNNSMQYDDIFSDNVNSEPPKIIVKAIIKVADNISAFVDISGVSDGVLVTPGMTLMNYGEIVSIDDSGVNWIWKGKNIKSKL